VAIFRTSAALPPAKSAVLPAGPQVPRPISSPTVSYDAGLVTARRLGTKLNKPAIATPATFAADLFVCHLGHCRHRGLFISAGQHR
jgi:hypothetical protein